MTEAITPADINELRRISALLDALEPMVNAAVAPKASVTKRIPLFLTQSLVFDKGNLSLKQRTWVNGAEDVYITKLGFSAIYIALGGIPITLSDQEIGIGMDDTEVDNVFDFVWNYQLASTSSQYLSSANNTFLVSRKSLGNKDRGRFLDFDPAAPLIIRAGDAVTFSIRAIMYPVPVIGASFSVAVNMFGIGYRDGKMAEAAYEIGGRAVQSGNVGGRRV